MTITFYTNPMSRGQVARWMLEEVDAPYEQVLLDYGTTMKGAEYLAINPMGKVPAIVHDGHVVTECAAICAYLADTFPAAGLAPTAAERADYYRWLFFAAGPVEQAVTFKFMQVPIEGRNEMMAGCGTYESAMAALDGWLAGHDYVCGGRFTAADVYVGAQVAWGLQFQSIPSTPAFEAYSARVTARPAYRKAKAIDEALIAEAKAAEAGAA